MTTKQDFKTLLVAGLALFAMFFGAGNLIFPTMIGVQAGSALTPAITGFLCTGVVLPALAIVAAATSQTGVQGATERMGKYFGFTYTLIIFLSTGVLYAIPRVATVSFEMSTKPHFPRTEGLALGVYSVIFFVLVAAFSLNTGKILDRIGTWLTPALLILIAVLVVMALFTLSAKGGQPVAPYDKHPLPNGILQGYFTMDAIASFVFGGIVIATLRNNGFTERGRLFGGTVIVGVIAAALLAIVYLGLANVGARVGDPSFKNGAEALGAAAGQIFGGAGQTVFGLIVILACLTTAVGLVGASAHFFCSIFPKITRPTMVMIHIFIATAFANLGLDAILAVVAPLNVLIYPITIMLTVVCLLDIAIPGHLHWAYRLGSWVAALLAVGDSIRAIPGHEQFAQGIWEQLPLGLIGLGWMLPAFVAMAIGIGIDVTQGRTHMTPEAQKRIQPIEFSEVSLGE
ncbi:MAG: branched-chain amino acid transport system II carrier protein [Actinomycetaceae bacterium]|nr:branched-chain amino acid transport system II carrier protein [Actinomycetaceae bacterium]